VTSQASNAGDWAAAADLVRRIQQGQPDAEAELVARYQRGIALIIAHACADRSDRSVIDDLCQETFRIAIERLRRGELREPARLSGFMCSLAKNLVTEHYRRTMRRERIAASADLDDRPTVDRSPSPHDAIEQQESAALVQQVLADLSTPRDRVILFRYYLAEDEPEEICAALGISRIHFNRVLFRARERFRELYQRATARRPAPAEPRESTRR
jgi:RNA polymerase sigma-70 factor (ECF subfamily)